MEEHNAPLSATSANISGMHTPSTVPEILAQFGERSTLIGTVIDGGMRSGVPSTVIRVMGDTVEMVREGGISKSALFEVVGFDVLERGTP